MDNAQVPGGIRSYRTRAAVSNSYRRFWDQDVLQDEVPRSTYTSPHGLDGVMLWKLHLGP